MSTNPDTEGANGAVPDRSRDLSYLATSVSFEPVGGCPWCSSGDLSHLATRGDGLEVKRCDRCGLAFLAELPDDLSVFYDSTYFTRNTCSPLEAALSGYEEYEMALTPSNFRWLAMLIRCATGHSAQSLLDVGAATGTFLEVARHEGFDVRGSELIPEGAEAAQAKGLDVVAGPFRAEDWPTGSFDVVTALEILEHVRDIRTTLTDLGRLVAEDGLLVFYVPSVPERYGNDSIDFNKSFEHTFYLEPHSLTMICEEIFGPDSLTLIEADGTEQGQTVSYALGFVRKRPVRDRPEERLVEELNGNALDRIPTAYEAQAVALTAAKFGRFDVATAALAHADIHETDPTLLAMTKAQVHRNRGELFDAIAILEQSQSEGLAKTHPLARSLLSEIIVDFFAMAGIDDGGVSAGLREVHRRLDRLDAADEALAHSQREIAALRDRAASLDADLQTEREASERHQEALEQRIAFAERSLVAERDRSGTLERSLGASDETLRWVEEQSSAAVASAAAWEEEAQQLRSDLDGIYTSRAWKIASGLWKIKRLVPGRRSQTVEAEEHEMLAATATASAPTLSHRKHPVTVSVIMPIYNKGRTIRESVDSVLAQTLRDTEIVIWDDGSTDEATAQALDEIGPLPRVTVVHATNQGVIGARNSAMRLARGEFLSCLDPDDRFSETYLEKAVLYLKSHPEVSIVYPWQQTVGGKQERWETQDLDPSQILDGNHVPVCAVFRRDVFDATGGFSSEMEDGAEDWELWAHAAELGFRGRVIRESLFEYSYSENPEESRDATARAKSTQIADRVRSLHPALAGAVEAPPGGHQAPALLDVDPPAIPSGVGRPVVLTLPWVTVGGADRVVEALVDHWTDQGRTVVAITTLGVGPGMDDRIDDLLALTPFVYQLPSILPEHLWYQFVGNILEALPSSTLLNVGSTWLHAHAVRLRRDHPDLRIIDQQFNSSGHIDANRRAQSALDLTVTAYKDLRGRFVKDGRSDHAVTSIYVGIEPTQVGEDDITDALTKLGLDGHDRYVTFAGRLAEEKRPEWLLPLADALVENGVLVMVIGTGPLADQIGVEFDEHPGIVWMRHVADTAPVFAGADATILPSKIEGIPLTAMESLAVGTPVVATAVGGLPELSHVNGMHLVDSDDESAFVEAVLSVLDAAPHDEISLPNELTLHGMLERYDGIVDPPKA